MDAARRKYPLHVPIWHNDRAALEAAFNAAGNEVSDTIDQLTNTWQESHVHGDGRGDTFDHSARTTLLMNARNAAAVCTRLLPATLESNRSTISLIETIHIIKQVNLEQKDPRGRTPLMLAVALGHTDCIRFLLSMNANVNIEDSQGFNGEHMDTGRRAVSYSKSSCTSLFAVLHEAITIGDPQLVSDVLQRRDYQRYSSRIDGVPALLRKLRDVNE